jgi:hypothetical protein
MQSVDLLDELLLLLGENALPEERLEQVWIWYEKLTGIKVGRPVPLDVRKEVAAELRLGSSGGTFLRRSVHLELVASIDLAEKAWHLSQMRCVACQTVVRSNGTIPLHRVFPVNVEPWSAQSIKGRRAVREAVSEELARRGQVVPWSESPLCLTVVALVPRRGSKKDVDNLAKGLLDSMNGIHPWDADVVFDDPMEPQVDSHRIESK